MFEAEARAVMSEGLDAASAKSTLEVGRICVGATEVGVFVQGGSLLVVHVLARCSVR